MYKVYATDTNGHKRCRAIQREKMLSILHEKRKFQASISAVRRYAKTSDCGYSKLWKIHKRDKDQTTDYLPEICMQVKKR